MRQRQGDEKQIPRLARDDNLCSGRYTARIRGKRVIREFAEGEFADGAKIRRSLDLQAHTPPP